MRLILHMIEVLCNGFDEILVSFSFSIKLRARPSQRNFLKWLLGFHGWTEIVKCCEAGHVQLVGGGQAPK